MKRRPTIHLPLLLLGLLLPTLWARAGDPGEGQTALDLPGYQAELDRQATAVANLEQRPETARSLRLSLPDSWRVRTPHGRYQVPTGWLQAGLKVLQRDPDNRRLRRNLEQRLAALRAEAEALAGSPAAPPVEPARARLEEILSRREFRGVRGPTWLDRVRQSIAFWLSDLFDTLAGVIRLPRQTGQIFFWVLLTVVLILVALWIKRSLPPLFSEPPAPPREPLPPAKSWRQWAREAQAAAGRGDYREAVRCAYWAGVYRLEELGAWKLERTRTPREYLRLLPADHRQRPALAALTRRFELVWYGRRPAGRDDFNEAALQLETLEWPSTPATRES